MRTATALAATMLLALGCAACRPGFSDSYPRWNRSREQRLAFFGGVEKLAVAPLRDPAGRQGMDPDLFARLMADQLMPYKRFKIIYPEQLVAAAEQANREELARRGPAGEDDLIDLDRSELDAVEAGRAAGADAVLVGTIHDFEVYPPKRLSVTFRVYLCGRPRRSAADVMRMTDDGVPPEIGGALRNQFVWERQRHYDASRKGTRLDMTLHASKHEKDRGYGDEIFYYSTEKFLGFVAAQNAGMLYWDSLWYRSLPGQRLIEKHKLSFGDLAPVGGSGFMPGDSERGLERAFRRAAPRGRYPLGADEWGQ
ncbi:MAG: hypothetical protein ACYTGB_09690 [Planctomycetota bacterium]|jgi:hypothetical protein